MTYCNLQANEKQRILNYKQLKDSGELDSFLKAEREYLENQLNNCPESEKEHFQNQLNDFLRAEKECAQINSAFEAGQITD